MGTEDKRSTKTERPFRSSKRRRRKRKNRIVLVRKLDVNRRRPPNRVVRDELARMVLGERIHGTDNVDERDWWLLVSVENMCEKGQVPMDRMDMSSKAGGPRDRRRRDRQHSRF